MDKMNELINIKVIQKDFNGEKPVGTGHCPVPVIYNIKC